MKTILVKTLSRLLLMSAVQVLPALAAENIVRLYEGKAPGSESWTHSEKENTKNMWNTRIVYNIADPTLTVFKPEPGQGNGTAVIICPGGAFFALSIDSEGNDVARWLLKKGVTSFVLKYRLVKCNTDDPTTEMFTRGKLETVAGPIIKLALADGLEAVRHVREHATNYGVNPRRIGVIGFSAGGTVSSSVAMNYTSENRPNFAASIYPAYAMTIKDNGVPSDAPPLFVLAASDDPLGLAPQSVQLYQDWIAAKKSAELHLYSKGGHGFGMHKLDLPSDHWIELFADWLGSQGLLKK